MYQLDFDEFLIANGFGNEAVEYLRQSFERRQSLPMEVKSGKDYKVHSAFRQLDGCFGLSYCCGSCFVKRQRDKD